MARRKLKAEEIRFNLLALPSLIGFMFFFIIPFGMSFYYSLVDRNFSGQFVGLQNYIDVITSNIFQNAAMNTFGFILICVPLNIVIPLSLALALGKISWLRNVFATIFLLPLVIPSGSIVFVWQAIFGLNGVINKLFFAAAPVSLLNISVSNVIIVIIFLWKNVGYNVVLFMAGLSFIPKEYYEIAQTEGSTPFKSLIHITLVYLTPTFFLVFFLSIINSFKAFKEIYLLTGKYPNQSVYMLQHYINNQFLSMNYQKLAAASYMLLFFVFLLIIVFFHLQRRFTRYL